MPNEDVYGNAWAMAWVVHQLGADPLRLYDANVFHPVPHAFAYTEPLLPQAAQAAPVLALGGSALLAHNLVLLATFPLAALGAYLLTVELFGTRRGGFLAGAAFAFCAYRYHHLVHVQSLSMQWLPFAVLYARRALRSARPRDAVLAGAFCLAQALSSGYYAVLVAAAVVVVVLFGARRASRAALVRLGAALAVAAACALVVFLPHRAALARESAVRGYQVMRSPEEMIHWSARFASYLEPGAGAPWPHQQALHAWAREGEPLFVGALVAALAIVGLAARRRSPAAWLLVACGAVGLVLSLGPYVTVAGRTFLGPLMLVANQPPFSALRTPSRFGLLAVLALCVLSGAGLAAVARRRVAAALLVVGVLLEAWPGPARRALVRPDPPPPPTVAWLAAAPRGVVLELPWDHETMGQGGTYIYWSTRHWQPMVNGWGGWYPTGPFELALAGKRFPSAGSARDLRRGGVRYVVVHLDALPPARRERILSTQGLPEGVVLASDLGAHRVYAIDPAGPTERRTRGEELLAPEDVPEVPERPAHAGDTARALAGGAHDAARQP